MPIHPTALVHPDTRIDPSASIGPYTVIEEGVSIGPDTVVGSFVYLSGRTTIGSRCHIHSRSSIGDVPQDKAYVGDPTGCIIGDDTVIREGVTIHRGSHAGTETVVGDRCILMVNSHVGHNCRIGNDVWLVNGALLAGHVQIEDKVIVSGNSGVHQFCRIGRLAMVGGMSKITRDIPPFFMTDVDGTCIGLNLVGLKRAGYGPKERTELKEAYKLLFRQRMSVAKAADIMEGFIETEPGRHLIAFLRQPSKRGITTGPTSGRVVEEE